MRISDGSSDVCSSDLVDVEAQVVELAVAAEHFGLAAGVELDPATRFQRLAGADLRPRLVARLQALDQDLDPPAAPGLAAEQPRRDHPGVVEHQQVALAQQPRQIAYVPVVETGPPPDRKSGG